MEFIINAQGARLRHGTTKKLEEEKGYKEKMEKMKLFVEKQYSKGSETWQNFKESNPLGMFDLFSDKPNEGGNPSSPEANAKNPDDTNQDKTIQLANIDSSKKPLTNPDDKNELPDEEPLELDQIQIRTKLNEGVSQ